MQLTRLSIAAALLAASLAGAARAEDRADLSFTWFFEPAPSQRLHVLHPQADVAVDAAMFTFRAGWDADIVSGATPRTYGKVDAVSAATQFSDARHAFHGGVELRGGPVTAAAGYTYAFERDYRSHVVEAEAKVDLLRRNTTFALSYAHNFDTVCDADNRGQAPLSRIALDNSAKCFTGAIGLVDEAVAIDSYQASWSQVLTRVLVFQLNVGLEVIDGFQSNPYRRVRLFDGAAEAQEAEPLLRQRLAIQARLKWALPSVRATIGLGGRFYSDTWGVRSGSAEIEAQKYLGERLLLRVRGRFYQQGRALFYRDAGEAASYESVGPVGQYFTGDRELSPFRDFLVGLKLSWLRSADGKGRLGRMFTDVDLHLRADAMKYQALTPLPPNAARSDGFVSALILQAGATVRF
jgi:hypothetical protein